MIKSLVLVGLGGFFGSIGRYLFGQIIFRLIEPVYPLSTLLVNLLGSFFIGVIYGIIEKGALLSDEWRIFLTVGLLGGFTTFSTFTIESVMLLRDGEYLTMLSYAFLTLIPGLLLCFLGIALIRII